jgi:hypothetical protein
VLLPNGWTATSLPQAGSQTTTAQTEARRQALKFMGTLEWKHAPLSIARNEAFALRAKPRGFRDQAPDFSFQNFSFGCRARLKLKPEA